ncbi:MAG: hypothetical protein HFJ33_04770 [Clostridia bacterium]|nr:hypothetical protein [Clostridia bacterium]
MKIKMVKMGMDIDETRNHRIRGIIPTSDGKYLFIEIMQGRRPDRKYTSCSLKEYEKRYPNPEYIAIDGCFRVDIPEDYFKNYTKEFSNYDRAALFEYAHTKENIVKLLQEFNKDIDDIELTDDYYIDKYCEEKGFFSLYDNRLKHDYKPIEVEWTDMLKNGDTRIKVLYTCYSANGLKYQEEQTRERDTQYFINEYGKETMGNLMTKYIDEKSKCIKNKEFLNSLIEDKNKLFEEEKEIDIEDSIDMDY